MGYLKTHIVLVLNLWKSFQSTNERSQNCTNLTNKNQKELNKKINNLQVSKNNGNRMIFLQNLGAAFDTLYVKISQVWKCELFHENKNYCSTIYLWQKHTKQYSTVSYLLIFNILRLVWYNTKN